MIRRDFFNHYKYDERCLTAQDYDLWARASEFNNYANISKVLLHYRVHDSQMWQLSSFHRKAGRENTIQAIKIFHSYLIGNDAHEYAISRIIEPETIKNFDELLDIYNYVKKLYKQYNEQKELNIMDILQIRIQTLFILINIVKKVNSVTKITKFWIILKTLLI